jgi:hypothetical protein
VFILNWSNELSQTSKLNHAMISYE